MARTKNRGIDYAISPYTKQALTWRLGKYLRLSKDDFKRGNIKDSGKDREKLISDSIENQRKILNAFEQTSIDEFEWSDEYKDDGFTGTDTDRDDFQRLLADVRSGKINCVVVKDLSRLSSMVVPITNVMNDQYCFQTSKKIRQVFDMKQRNGEYIAPFAPHGYVKNPEDRHALVVDPEAAEVVKQIFSMFLGGMNKTAIVLYLNEHGVLSPSEYKRSKGMVYKTQLTNGGKAMWGAKMIDNILTHPLYTWDMVQGRCRVKSYKIHDIENVPQEDWVIVENTHEAIIEKPIDKLTREILIELVDHIKVYEGGDISIKFKFADEYRRVAEYIEANKQKEAV